MYNIHQLSWSRNIQSEGLNILDSYGKENNKLEMT
jgi:hypothetical protein